MRLLSSSALMLALAAAPALAQPTLSGDGDTITIKTVTQTLPTLTQYTKVEKPNYDQVPDWSNGRITIEPSTWAEYGVTANDILNLVRQGQVDVTAAPLAQVSGQVPFLEIADLAGLSLDVETAKTISDAVIDALGKLKKDMIGRRQKRKTNAAARAKSGAPSTGPAL